MSSRSRFAVAVLTAGLLAYPILASAPAEGAEPTLQINATSLSVGGTTAITGAGWPENTALRAELCGANAVDGDVDCAQNASVVFSPGPDGAVQGLLQVIAPPKPCPCLVRVTTVDWSKTIDFPVQVAGVGMAPVHSQAPPVQQPALKVISSSVSAEHSLGAFFGFSAPRTLNVVLQNVGTTNLDEPVLTAAFGKNAAHGQTIDTRGFHPTTIAPGARIAIRVPFHLGAFAVGGYQVAGDAGAAPAARVTFKTHTSQWPWGLFALCVIGIQIVLLAIRDRARRRLVPVDGRPREQETRVPEPSIKRAPVPEPVLPRVAAVAVAADSEPSLGRQADGPVLHLRRLRNSAAVVAAVRKFEDIARRSRESAPGVTANGHAVPSAAPVAAVKGDELALSGLAPIDEVSTFDTLAYWALDYRIRGMAKPSTIATEPNQRAAKPKAQNAKAGRPSAKTRQPAAKPKKPTAKARRESASPRQLAAARKVG